MNERRAQLELWSGVLAAPLAWTLHINATHLLATPGNANPSFYLITAFALALALTGVAFAWRAWRRHAHTSPEGASPEARSRMLALLGLCVSTLFTLAILAQTVIKGDLP
jgi:hypothetical protein